MQETWVQPLVLEDHTRRGATKPMLHNYWACGRQLLSAEHPRARCLCRKKPAQWETHTLQIQTSPCSPQREKSPCSSEDPTQPINESIKCNNRINKIKRRGHTCSISVINSKTKANNKFPDCVRIPCFFYRHKCKKKRAPVSRSQACETPITTPTHPETDSAVRVGLEHADLSTCGWRCCCNPWLELENLCWLLAASGLHLETISFV